MVDRDRPVVVEILDRLIPLGGFPFASRIEVARETV
jgi:hypothetical protein